MASQRMGGEMFVLDELDFDAGVPSSPGDIARSHTLVGCGMTFLTECVLDAGTPLDPVEAQVERLAKLITASPDPVGTAARAVQLLRDQLAQPPLGPTGRP